MTPVFAEAIRTGRGALPPYRMAGDAVIIPEFDLRPTFASFLPAIAGVHGRPMWAFYVNRGQAISSFGVGGKDGAFLEFQPATRAYELVDRYGFRTVLIDDDDAREPFGPDREAVVVREMEITPEALTLRERATHTTVETTVCGVVDEPFAALFRRLSITNTSDGDQRFVLVDGLPAVVPFGITNGQLKFITNTALAWMTGTLERDADGRRWCRFAIPATVADETTVSEVAATHFAAAIVRTPGGARWCRPVVDPRLVFGSDRSLRAPLADVAPGSLPETGTLRSVQPAALFVAEIALAPGETAEIEGLFGHAPSCEATAVAAARLDDEAVGDRWIDAARQTRMEVTAPVRTRTANATFDAYLEQTLLDNVLRGGMPWRAGAIVAYPFSRRHGDLERDYNEFDVPSRPFSSGSGNFRDVLQNRRNDVRLAPWVGPHTVISFLELIQADGFNPLKVTTGLVRLGPVGVERWRERFGEPAPAGAIALDVIAERVCGDASRAGAEIAELLADATEEVDARFGEGYWIDHWTYLLDAVDAYRSIYPDRLEELLDAPARTIDTAVHLRPYGERLSIVDDTLLRGGALAGHAELANRRAEWLSDADGTPIVMSVREKLALLLATKVCGFDPHQLGLEMEADRPGWYDALNGLPALFGSSVSEVFEMERLARLVEEAGVPTGARWHHVTAALVREIGAALDAFDVDGDRLALWRALVAVRDGHRHRARGTGHVGSSRLEGDAGRPAAELAAPLARIIALVRESGRRVRELWGRCGYAATYLQFTPRLDAAGDVGASATVLERIGRWDVRVLPPFLEGYVKGVRGAATIGEARGLHGEVRAGELYDRSLRMYRVNGSLDDEPHAIGRARAFTPGWLENGSVWLHMEYKYLYALLERGLTREFFDAAADAMIPFLDPERYGRPTTEHSSFIASSRHVDETIHGRGFVARLSGATAEALSIWFTMMAGAQPFTAGRDGTLAMRFTPAIPARLFAAEGGGAVVGFTFLGNIWVEHRCDEARDLTPDAAVCRRIDLGYRDGTARTFFDDTITGTPAHDVRDGRVGSISLHWEHIDAHR